MFVFTIGDVLGLIFTLLVILCVIVMSAKKSLAQRRCKHDGSVYETMACQARCNKCGKELGSISTWREKQQKEQQ